MPKKPAKYFEMTQRRQADLRQINHEIALHIERRYKAGQKEHGGDLWKKACTPRLFDELVDTIVYFHTIKKRMREWEDLLSSACTRLGCRIETPSHKDVYEKIRKVHDQIKRELASEETDDEVY